MFTTPTSVGRLGGGASPRYDVSGQFFRTWPARAITFCNDPGTPITLAGLARQCHHYTRQCRQARYQAVTGVCHQNHPAQIHAAKGAIVLPQRPEGSQDAC